MPNFMALSARATGQVDTASGLLLVADAGENAKTCKCESCEDIRGMQSLATPFVACGRGRKNEGH